MGEGQGRGQGRRQGPGLDRGQGCTLGRSQGCRMGFSMGVVLGCYLDFSQQRSMERSQGDILGGSGAVGMEGRMEGRDGWPTTKRHSLGRSQGRSLGGRLGHGKGRPVFGARAASPCPRSRAGVSALGVATAEARPFYVTSDVVKTLIACPDERRLSRVHAGRRGTAPTVDVASAVVADSRPTPSSTGGQVWLHNPDLGQLRPRIDERTEAV